MRLPSSEEPDGSLAFADGTRAIGLHQVGFVNDGDAIRGEALADSGALLMSGEPIGERIVSNEPFVMNTV